MNLPADWWVPLVMVPLCIAVGILLGYELGKTALLEKLVRMKERDEGPLLRVVRAELVDGAGDVVASWKEDPDKVRRVAAFGCDAHAKAACEMIASASAMQKENHAAAAALLERGSEKASLPAVEVPEDARAVLLKASNLVMDLARCEHKPPHGYTGKLGLEWCPNCGAIYRDTKDGLAGWWHAEVGARAKLLDTARGSEGARLERAEAPTSPEIDSPTKPRS